MASPNPTIENNSYTGEFAGQYISASIQSADSVQHLTIRPNVRYQEVIRLFNGGVTLQDMSCDFTAENGATLGEIVLAVKQLKVNEVFCKTNFVNTWETRDMGFSVLNETIPASLTEYIIQNMIAEVSAEVENNIWKGQAGAGSMDGFFQIATDRADVNLVASPVALTTGNIIEKLDLTIDELPSSVLASAEKPLIYVSPKTARLYLRKMQSLGYLDTYYAGEVPMLFEGLQIVECAGMYDDAIWIAKKSNMFLGTSLLAFDNEVSVLDMAKLDGSKNVRFIMNFSAGVQYGIGSDIAVYWVD
jgi:hypothetical protein